MHCPVSEDVACRFFLAVKNREYLRREACLATFLSHRNRHQPTSNSHKIICLTET